MYTNCSQSSLLAMVFFFGRQVCQREKALPAKHAALGGRAQAQCSRLTKSTHLERLESKANTMGAYLARKEEAARCSLSSCILSDLRLICPAESGAALLLSRKSLLFSHAGWLWASTTAQQCRGKSVPCITAEAAMWQHLRGIDMGCGSWGAAPGEGQPHGSVWQRGCQSCDTSMLAPG